MKIVVDGRFWGPGHTGLGVYTQQLVEHLVKIDKKNQYVVLRRPDIPAYTIREQIIIPFLLYREHPDLVHFPSINVPLLYLGRYVVTVHDLIKHQSRGTTTSTHHPLVYWPKYFLYLFIVWWAVHRARAILVPSQDVKDRLLATYHLAPGKITVTYEAAVLAPQKGATKLPQLPERFAVYTGNAYPHKNLARLVNIWPKIFAKTKTRLVIFCGRSVFTSRIESLAKTVKNVFFMGYLSNQDLVRVYPFAEAYVFPSLAEGFGIPGLDAMNFSLPVVCSDIAVLHEIYGPAALYFDPKNEKDMAQKIVTLLTDANLCADLVRQGKTK